MLDGVEMMMTKIIGPNDGLEIAYGNDVPVALREAGVTTGTMLIRGQWEENILIGEAWAFSKDCKPISYAIRGTVDYHGSLVVFGPIPTTCKVDDYEHYSWGKAAVMRFDIPPPVAAETAKKSKRKRVEKPAPPPKPKAAPRRQPPAAPRYQPSYPQQWPGVPQQWWR